MTTSYKSIEQYLQDPYTRIVIPDPETGTFTAQIMEFPGCVAQGDTPQEAYENLEEAAKGWLQAAIDMAQPIPEPAAAQTYGGKVLLRLPRSLHRQATVLAEQEGVSLNQFIVAALSEKVGVVRVEREWMDCARNYFARTQPVIVGQPILAGDFLGITQVWSSEALPAHGVHFVAAGGPGHQTIQMLTMRSDREKRGVVGHG